MSDEPEGAILSPWTVKDMPREMSARAVAYARRHQITVAQVVSEALAIRLDQHMPSKPIRIQPDQDRLIAIAALPLPKWLRSRVNRLLAESLGISPPPAPPRRLRLAVSQETVSE